MSTVQLSTLGAIIKLAYEGEADTNAFTDALLSLVNSAIQAGDLDTLVKLNALVGVDLATEAFVNAAVTGLYDHKGSYDASLNVPDLDVAPSGIKVGDAYTVSVAGNFYAVTMEPGDVLIADQDDPTEAAHWTIVNRNIDSSAFATAAQGALADSAVQPGDIGTAAAEDVGYFATAAQGATADTLSKGYIGAHSETDITYELVLSDAGKLVEKNCAVQNYVNIPANSAVPFPVNTRIDVFQYGVGQTTITITDDTLLGNVDVPTRYGMVSLWKKSSTIWVVTGGAA